MLPGLLDGDAKLPFIWDALLNALVQGPGNSSTSITLSQGGGGKFLIMGL